MGTTQSSQLHDKSEIGTSVVPASGAVATAQIRDEDCNKNYSHQGDGKERPANALYVQRWEFNYKCLEQYKQKYGDCFVNSSYKTNKGILLGRWLENQKAAYKQETLLYYRFIRLKKLGVSFTKKPRSTVRSLVNDQRWEQFRQQIISYKTVEGDCNVPSTYKVNPSLAKWVENQRSSFHKNKLSQERIELLKQIDFNFGKSNNDRWELRLKQFEQFNLQYKSVPQKYTANPGLGRWVRKQKVMMKSGKLPIDRHDQLKELGL